MTALMGPSGAGKTTLMVSRRHRDACFCIDTCTSAPILKLPEVQSANPMQDVLALRKTGGLTTGYICLNGEPLEAAALQRVSGCAHAPLGPRPAHGLRAVQAGMPRAGGSARLGDALSCTGGGAKPLPTVALRPLPLLPAGT